MDAQQMRELATRWLNGEIGDQQYFREYAASATQYALDATLDLDRQRRCGFPEVVFAEGKSSAQLVSIMGKLVESSGAAFATRVSANQAAELSLAFKSVRYNEIARTAVIDESPASAPMIGHVVVVTAGTSDLPVAEEAMETLAWMSVHSHLIQDVGVAGPHRLVMRASELQAADAVIVVAGMEGALPSVVGGYVDCPVIGVPASTGYGANLNGMAALLSMLNSCASNVAVVNVDSGFKGAYIAGMMARRCQAHATAADGNEGEINER
ncbi:MAG: nickel pincer cofactor biosynthesis protein LarB [Planctomycetales bacterium]|nr:nickel pincer cofactor biosynthesis protein LarB [Planctomycetales bacterium]